MTRQTVNPKRPRAESTRQPTLFELGKPPEPASPNIERPFLPARHSSRHFIFHCEGLGRCVLSRKHTLTGFFLLLRQAIPNGRNSHPNAQVSGDSMTVTLMAGEQTPTETRRDQPRPTKLKPTPCLNQKGPFSERSCQTASYPICGQWDLNGLSTQSKRMGALPFPLAALYENMELPRTSSKFSSTNIRNRNS